MLNVSSPSTIYDDNEVSMENAIKEIYQCYEPMSALYNCLHNVIKGSHGQNSSFEYGSSSELIATLAIIRQKKSKTIIMYLLLFIIISSLFF